MPKEYEKRRRKNTQKKEKTATTEHTHTHQTTTIKNTTTKAPQTFFLFFLTDRVVKSPEQTKRRTPVAEVTFLT